MSKRGPDRGVAVTINAKNGKMWAMQEPYRGEGGGTGVTIIRRVAMKPDKDREECGNNSVRARTSGRSYPGDLG